jgi:hypothetical protein
MILMHAARSRSAAEVARSRGGDGVEAIARGLRVRQAAPGAGGDGGGGLPRAGARAGDVGAGSRDARDRTGPPARSAPRGHSDWLGTARIRDKTGCRRRPDLTRLALTAGPV